MAAQFFNRISQLGVGVALTAGVINSALYNGRMFYYSTVRLLFSSIVFFS
jgi:hypothetical protein